MYKSISFLLPVLGVLALAGCTGQKGDKPNLAAGKQIAMQGKGGIPACTSCHGSSCRSR